MAKVPPRNRQGAAKPPRPKPAPPPSPPATPPASVTTLRIGVWLLAAEAVGLAILAIVLLVVDVRGQAERQQGAVGVIGYVVVIAGVLGLLARALHRRRAWARGPAIVLHMLTFPFGIAMASGGQPLFGVIGIVVGLGGTVVLLAPATRAAVGR